MNAALSERWSSTFTADTAAVRAARQFVIASPAVDGVDRGLLEMAVSELVTNAVLHARTDFVVTLARLDGAVRVEVTDASTVLPRQRQVDSSSVTGRGLTIVASVADRWGYEPTATGKTVWFEMDRRDQ
jgi:anti-sigma regulatory factor (Ser/Thr protein kinase)